MPLVKVTWEGGGFTFLPTGSVRRPSSAALSRVETVTALATGVEAPEKGETSKTSLM